MANRIFERLGSLDPFLYFPTPLAFPFVILSFIVTENRDVTPLSLSLFVCVYLFLIERDPKNIFKYN